jgi:proline iminopeptidase
MTTYTIDFDGLPLTYHVHGQGEATIVAVPGGQGCYWDYLRMPAVEEHATVVYLEPLGTGASGRLPGHPYGYTREVHARSIDRLLDELGPGPVHLLGHSYGGFITQHYALTRPERLAGIVLYDSAPATDAEFGAEFARQVGLFVRRNEDNPEVPGVLAAIESVDHLTGDDELTAALRGLLPSYFADYWKRAAEFEPLRETVRVWYVTGAGADGTPDPIDDRAGLPGLALPAVVIVGRFDVICGERWSRELHELIPVSRLRVLEHSGHFGHVEEPGEFAKAVIDLVSR